MSGFLVTREGPVVIITINRPEKMNPLGQDGDGDTVQAICAEINADIDTRCVILTGAGKAFSAGGDVKAMSERIGSFGGTPAQLREHYRRNIHRMARAFYGLDVPLIAAVNGAAIGLGCDMACMADIRIASDKARFGVTFLKLGLIPGDGGSWLLPRAIGMSRAAELFYTGDLIDAETAEKWGLVSAVVPHELLMEKALEKARKIAAMPPNSLRVTKSLLRQGQMVSYDTALELAAASQPLMHHTSDHAEGVSALLEKRDAVFTGQ